MFYSRTISVSDKELVAKTAAILRVINYSLINKCPAAFSNEENIYPEFHDLKTKFIQPYIRREQKRGRIVTSTLYTRVKDKKGLVKIPNLNIILNKVKYRIAKSDKVVAANIKIKDETTIKISLIVKNYRTERINKKEINFEKLVREDKNRVCGIDFGIYKIAVNDRIFLFKEAKRLTRRINYLRKKFHIRRRIYRRITKYKEQQLWNISTNTLRNLKNKIIKAQRKLQAFYKTEYSRVINYICSNFNVVGIEKTTEINKYYSINSHRFLKLLRNRIRTKPIKVLYVNPKNNSQVCCKCKQKCKTNKFVATCSLCKSVLDRDINAALNIRDLTVRRVLESTPPGRMVSTPGSGRQSSGRYQSPRRVPGTLRLHRGDRDISRNSGVATYRRNTKFTTLTRWRKPKISKLLQIYKKLDRILNFSGTKGTWFGKVQTRLKNKQNIDELGIWYSASRKDGSEYSYEEVMNVLKPYLNWDFNKWWEFPDALRKKQEREFRRLSKKYLG
ncbi:MAG: zinc ribbon domain-containing protein [Nitrososphaerota archaeon]